LQLRTSADPLAAHNWEFFANQSTVIVMPRRLAQLRAAGGDDAVQLARFLRFAQVWGILMLGSALALVAACIQPALAWHRLGGCARA
jgi:hypothetical protein